MNNSNQIPQSADNKPQNEFKQLNQKSPEKSTDQSHFKTNNLQIFSNLSKLNQSKKLEQDLLSLQSSNNNQVAFTMHQNIKSHQMDLPTQLATVALMAQQMRTQSPTYNPSQSTGSGHEQFKHFNPFILNQSKPHVDQNQNHHQTQSQTQNQQQQLQSLAPAFRQQPPPMKVILRGLFSLSY